MNNQNQFLKQNGEQDCWIRTDANKISFIRKRLGDNVSEKKALEYFYYNYCMPVSISLEDLAPVLNIPGGTQALERLLMGAGFLKGTCRSKPPHLPYKRFINRMYFKASYKRNSLKKIEFDKLHITEKGLVPVLAKLKLLGLKITLQMERKIKFIMYFDPMQ